MVCRTVTIEGPQETDDGGTGGGDTGGGDTGSGGTGGGDTGGGGGNDGGRPSPGPSTDQGILEFLRNNKTVAAGAGIAGLGVILATRGGDNPGQPIMRVPRRTVSRTVNRQPRGGQGGGNNRRQR